MSKIVVSSKDNDSRVGWGSGILLHDNSSDFLVGRICTLLESLGLKDSQETAIKSLAKQEIYNAFSQDQGARWIDGKLHSVVRNLLYKADERSKERSEPSGSLHGDIEIIFTPEE